MNTLTYLAAHAPDPPQKWFTLFQSKFYRQIRPIEPITPYEHQEEVWAWKRDRSYDLPENLSSIQTMWEDFYEKDNLAYLQASLQAHALWSVTWARAILTQMNQSLDDMFEEAFPSKE